MVSRFGAPPGALRLPRFGASAAVIADARRRQRKRRVAFVTLLAPVATLPVAGLVAVAARHAAPSPRAKLVTVGLAIDAPPAEASRIVAAARHGDGPAAYSRLKRLHRAVFADGASPSLVTIPWRGARSANRILTVVTVTYNVRR